MWRDKTGMSVGVARMIIFLIWLAIVLVYWLTFTNEASRKGINPQEADQAAWTVLYMFVPVFVAFASFYLGPHARENFNHDLHRHVRWDQFAIALIVTLVFHGGVLYRFYARVWSQSFDWPVNSSANYLSAVNDEFQVLLFVSAVPIIAVNFLLGRTDVAMWAASKPETTTVVGG